VQAIRALLEFKETKSVEIRQSFSEKLRKLTVERDNFERKCQRLEKQVSDMDKQKYSLELKAKEMEDSARKVKHSQLGDQRGSSTITDN